MRETRTITVMGKRRRVTLVAETEVERGLQAGALRREHLDDDGQLHVRYDHEDLVGPALLELRARQARDPRAVAAAATLSKSARRRVLGIPSGTVAHVLGVAWARHGSVYLVGESSLPVPRSLLSGTLPETSAPAPTPARSTTPALTHVPEVGWEEWSRAQTEAAAAFGAHGGA